jgi:hypothetical protein
MLWAEVPARFQHSSSIPPSVPATVVPAPRAVGPHGAGSTTHGGRARSTTCVRLATGGAEDNGGGHAPSAGAPDRAGQHDGRDTTVRDQAVCRSVTGVDSNLQETVPVATTVAMGFTGPLTPGRPVVRPPC